MWTHCVVSVTYFCRPSVSSLGLPRWLSGKSGGVLEVYNLRHQRFRRGSAGYSSKTASRHALHAWRGTQGAPPRAVLTKQVTQPVECYSNSTGTQGKVKHMHGLCLQGCTVTLGSVNACNSASSCTVQYKPTRCSNSGQYSLYYLYPTSPA